eukprot:COSAG06_NODE_837_length_12033_cov_4.155574_2_plen_34_part_00
MNCTVWSIGLFDRLIDRLTDQFSLGEGTESVID